MALIDIEYGSLASSETLNKNFMYLDDKIADTSESMMTSISSILSNIATINARINDISVNMEDSVESINSTIDDYKTKTKLLVKKASMIPNWNLISSISLSNRYTAPSNGFILIHPDTTSEGNIVINDKTIVYKQINVVYDNSSELTTIPVYNGDVIYTSVSLLNAYFIPTLEISLEDF